MVERRDRAEEPHDGWNWTATASILLAIGAPFLTYFGMWERILRHGPSSRTPIAFLVGLSLCLLAGVLGFLGFVWDRRRGKWMGLAGIVVGLVACWVIAWILADDMDRVEFFPFLR
ncbi:MAG: hypothetical protein KDB80_00970 [Planctomycetes bacterium]|nr:hypothetical protein [Planctomycetota bacterium]